MRRVVVALALAGAWLLAPISAYADPTLTSLVNAAYLPRTEDAELHDIAHQRAVEISTDWSHNGIRPGTAEVLAYNSGLTDPVSRAVAQWQGSPDHDAILSDPAYTRIGCAEYVTDGTHWFACVLAAPIQPTPIPAPEPTGQPSNVGGSESTSPPAATPQPVLLPDTAIAHDGGRR